MGDPFDTTFVGDGITENWVKLDPCPTNGRTVGTASDCDGKSAREVREEGEEEGEEGEEEEREARRKEEEKVV